MADVSALSSHSRFQLKPSRLALVFQWVCLFIISCCLFNIFNIVLWLVTVLVMVVIYFVFLKQAKIQKIEQLDHEEWSIQYLNSTDIQRGKIIRMIDHKIYIVIYLHDKKIKPLVVWQDQVSDIQWKMLKIRIKLA